MKIHDEFIVNSQVPESDKTLAPPVAIALDCDISVLGKAILNGRKASEDSIYLKIKSFLFYGLMHDGITNVAKNIMLPYI